VLLWLYNHGLWISWPFFFLGVSMLCFSIVTVVRLGGKNLICSLPLKGQQAVEF